MARREKDIAELVTPGRLDAPLIVIRKVRVSAMNKRPNKRTPSIWEKIGLGHLEQGTEERETVWYEDGYVVNDQPRSHLLTEEIMKNTLGFAVARTDNGEIIHETGPEGLVECERAISGASFKISVGVNVDEAVDDEDEEDADVVPPTEDDESEDADQA